MLKLLRFFWHLLEMLRNMAKYHRIESAAPAILPKRLPAPSLETHNAPAFFADVFSEPAPEEQTENRDYMNLVDFALAYYKTSVWAIQQGILGRVNETPVRDAKQFKNHLYYLLNLAAEMGRNLDYAKAENLGTRLEPHQKKTIYVHLPTAMSILTLTDGNGNVLEDLTKKLFDKFKDFSINTNLRSERGLVTDGFEKLYLQGKPKAWRKEVFDNQIWPAITNQKPKGGYGINPPPRPREP
jgi:hypothetical protein